MQEKENQKVVYISLSPFTQILNMKNIPKKKKKNSDQPTQGLQIAEIALISLKLGNRSIISQIISMGRLD